MCYAFYFQYKRMCECFYVTFTHECAVILLISINFFLFNSNTCRRQAYLCTMISSIFYHFLNIFKDSGRNILKTMCRKILCMWWRMPFSDFLVHILQELFGKADNWWQTHKSTTSTSYASNDVCLHNSVLRRTY